MKKAIFYGTIIAGIAVMMALSITPAMATHTHGIILSINPSEKHGMIERIDDDSNTIYQFSIPKDLWDPTASPSVGNSATFTVDPENSRHATDVKICPPDCHNGHDSTGI